MQGVFTGSVTMKKILISNSNCNFSRADTQTETGGMKEDDLGIFPQWLG